MNESKLIDIKNNINKLLEEKLKTSKTISILRGISFLLIVSFIVLYFILKINFIFTIIFIIIFIFLLIIHNKIDNNVKYYKNYINVIDNYIRRINGTYKGKKTATGLEFYSKEFNYLKDLDIIGDDSLYQFINICKTHRGKRKLFDSFTNIDLDNHFHERQECIKELGDNLEFCLQFEASNYRIEDNAFYNLVKELKLKHGFIFSILGILFTLSFIIIFILAGFGIINPYFLVIPCLCNICLYLIFNFLEKKSLEEIKNSNNISSSIYDALKAFVGINFKSKLLDKLSNYIIIGKKEVKKLTITSDFDSIRYNPIMAIIFNSVLPISIIVSYILEKMINKNEDIINNGINAFWEFEMLISLSVIKHAKENVTLPIRSENIMIETSNLKHPLLNESKCVPNDFETKNGINIITGSNMSGKTSFMRTIGINIILMNAGTYVNATYFKAPYLKVFTSMRISDNITKGISTFYAELLEIKKAIDYLGKGENMLTLIDEVFSGTNSNDRINGAIKLIKMLDKPNSIVIMTTHDFELCDIKHENITNYHFSEYYENDMIKFDYKIKKGKCNTTNAHYLMRLVGIE